MSSRTDDIGFKTGDVVRDRKWGGQFTGLVQRVHGRDVFVVWDGGFTEDQLNLDDIEHIHGSAGAR